MKKIVIIESCLDCRNARVNQLGLKCTAKQFMITSMCIIPDWCPLETVSEGSSCTQLRAKIAAWRKVLETVGPRKFTLKGWKKLLDEMGEENPVKK